MTHTPGHLNWLQNLSQGAFSFPSGDQLRTNVSNFFNQPQQLNRQDFYQQWFSNGGSLTPGGTLDVNSYMSNDKFDMNKVLEDLYSGDDKREKNALKTMAMADSAYASSSDAESGLQKVMNNPTFVMGLNLMKAAGEGKGITDALAPSMEATQAFMTNQELRKQNKKLLRQKDGSVLETFMDYRGSNAAVSTAESGATIASFEADKWMESFNARMKGLNLSNEKGEIELEIFKATKDNQIKIVETELNNALNMVEKGDLDIKVLTNELKYLDKTNKAKYERLLIENEILSEDKKQEVVTSKLADIQLMNTQDERTLNENWFAEVDAMDVSDKQKNRMKRNGPDGWFEMINEQELIKVNSDYEKNHKSSISKSKAFKFFTNFEDEANIEEMLHEQIKSQAVKIAAANDRKMPSRADYLEAEELIYNSHNIKENSSLWQWLGGSRYTIGIGNTVGRQYGGSVNAGQTYTVGEDGPETFVPNQDGKIISNPGTPGGYTWEDAIIDNSEMLSKIKQASGKAAAIKALKKFRPDLYV
jgi:uncharacterized protein (DUF2344 family)